MPRDDIIASVEDLDACLKLQTGWTLLAHNDTLKHWGGGHFVGFKHVHYANGPLCTALRADMQLKLMRMQAVHPDLTERVVRVTHGTAVAKMELFILPKNTWWNRVKTFFWNIN
jgi:hypothetical protein